MDVADNGWVKHTGGGVEGIDSGVNTELGKVTGEHSCGVQVSECSGWCGIGQIVSGHIDGLHRSDGTGLGSGDTFLEGTEICGQSGLIADSRGNTSEQGRHLRASLGEPEDVIDEKQHVLALLISEVLCDGQSSESDSGSSSWGLVHLSVDESASGAGLVDLDDTRFDHFVVEIVALSSPLADTGKHGVTTVGLGDVIDQFLNDHGLAHTGTTEKTDLTSSGVGGQHVDDLDTSDQNLSA